MENDYRWHGMPPDLMDVSGSPPKGKQEEKALEEKKKEELEIQNS